MHRRPLVSIAMTCFNAADTIQLAVESALAQTWPNTEIVINDTGSTDGTWEILQRLAADHSKVRLLRSPNGAGMAPGINGVVAEARGEFIAIMNEDDASHPERISLQYETLIGYEAGRELAAFCYCGDDMSRVACGTMFGRPSSFQKIGGLSTAFRRSEDHDLEIWTATFDAHFISTPHPAEDGVGADDEWEADPLLRLMLCRKHKYYLKQRGAYYASLAFAYAHHFRCARRHWRAAAFELLGRALSPPLMRDRSGADILPPFNRVDRDIEGGKDISSLQWQS